MAAKLNQDGQVLWYDVMKLDEVVKLNPDEELARSKAEPWFKPKPGSVFPVKRRSVKRMMFDKMVQSVAPISHPARSKAERSFKPKPGSVFPAKRKLVKRMMFDYMVQSVAPISHPPGCPSSSGASQSKAAHGCFNIFPPTRSPDARKSKTVYPKPA